MNHLPEQLLDNLVKQKFECLTLVLSAALALSACGGTAGGSENGTTTSSSASLADQVRRAAAATQRAVPVPIADASGSILTYSTFGFIDNSNLFFTPLGNGRSCSTCHQEGQAWSVTPAALAARFAASKGTDPVFQLIDGANSPLAAVTTLAQKQSAYSMLLTKGLIRVGLPIPNGAEFQPVQVSDPYGYASPAQLSLFRRPLPTANLKFNSTVMWDGRETLGAAGPTQCLANTSPAACYAPLATDLLAQSNTAVQTHAQLLAGLTAAQQQSIVDFESGIYVAQSSDNVAGSLSANGAAGGAQNLSANTFHFGINDFLAGDYQTKAAFNRNAMSVFTGWAGAAPPPAPNAGGVPPTTSAAARASIARGEQIFNARPFNITGVAGLNDAENLPSVRGTCTTCHDSPNAGTQSVPRLFNTGVAAAPLRTADLPLYTLKNLGTGAMVQTSDPGRALITGKWADIGKFKVPNLRGLAARGPYFHNGSQAGAADVVRFYDRRFQIGLAPQEVSDLTNFLLAL